jgi:putative intracellular protease/amidase
VGRMLEGQQRGGHPPPIGKAALIASAGGQRGYADWTNPDHRLRRLLSEFIGMAGLTFILSGGAAILAKYGGHAISPWEKALVLSVVSGLWLVVAVYFLGDISAHFNPGATLAFALRRDMELGMVIAYWIVQFAAAAGGRCWPAPSSGLRASWRPRCRSRARTGRRSASRRSSPSA